MEAKMENLWVCFGPPRTGSTWCFNVVRELLIRSRTPFSSGHKRTPPLPWADRSLSTAVWKTHRWPDGDLTRQLIDRGSIRLLTTVRVSAITE